METLASVEVLHRQMSTAKNKSNRKWWEKIVFRKNVSTNSPAIRRVNF
jgi:hypothetical protein